MKLNGLRSTFYSDKCGLVVGSAGSVGRVSSLLWCESAPKTFPVLNVVAMEPADGVDDLCCGCRSAVSLLDVPACLCDESSKALPIVREVRAYPLLEEVPPGLGVSTSVSEPSPPRTAHFNPLKKT